MTIDFTTTLKELRSNIQSELYKILMDNNCEVKVPFFYEEENEHEDYVQELIENGYNVQVGNVYQNIEVPIVDYWGELINIELVSVFYEKTNSQIWLMDKDFNHYNLKDIENTDALVQFYNNLISVLNK